LRKERFLPAVRCSRRVSGVSTSVLNSITPIMNINKLAIAKLGFLNRRTSMTGDLRYHSQMTRATRLTAAVIASVRMKPSA
jgi:hypothetical protein